MKYFNYSDKSPQTNAYKNFKFNTQKYKNI